MLSSRFRREVHLLVIASLMASLIGLLTPSASGAVSSWEVIATGLDNPRGLTVMPDGTIYVAEAGRGGDGPCVPGPEDPESLVCFGTSSALTRIADGEQERVVEGLPSIAEQDGSAAIGLVDVSAVGDNVLLGIIGLGAAPESRAMFGEDGTALGHLVRLWPDGDVRLLADVSAYEDAANPDGGAIDSNPYSLVARGAARAVVADAGGNALLHVAPGGSITTLAVFPERMVDAPPFLGLPPGTQIPMQAVPDSVVKGPDGAYYVGELTGFPFVQGAARVWRVARGEEPTVYAEGFTNIIDLAFDDDGNLYVLEIVKNGLLQAEGPDGDLSGALYRVSPDGTTTEIASEGLIVPGGLAIGPDGTIYVSNMSIMPGTGEVIAITP